MIVANTDRVPHPVPDIALIEESDEPSSTQRLLQTMENCMPWPVCRALAMPFYHSAALTLPLDSLLRLYLVGDWFGLGLDDLYDAVIESNSMREFVRIEGPLRRSPFSQTIRTFDALLERNNLKPQFRHICEHALQQRQSMLVPGRRHAPQIQPIRNRSPGLDALVAYFASITAPYDLGDIRGFNEIYRRIHPDLLLIERLQAETYVETLIAGVARPNYTTKIFGVV